MGMFGLSATVDYITVDVRKQSFQLLPVAIVDGPPD